MNILFRLWAAVGIVCVPGILAACDLCGCSGGSSSMGLLPLVQRHFVGFRWQTQGFDTDAHGSELNSVETFRTLDLWGRWQPHRRVQVIVSLPYQFNERRFSDGSTLHTRGMGDAVLLTQYAVLDPAKQSTRNWQHSLQFGAGLKLPTGKNTLTDSEHQLLTPALQPGSGSTDLMLSALYALRRGVWGASADATIRLTTTNASEYKIGNRFNSAIRGFWVKKVQKTTFLPFAGLQMDMRDLDRQEGIWQTETGGWAAMGMVGAEVFRGNIAFSISAQVPVLHSLSDGKVTPEGRVNAGVTLLFGGKTKAVKIDAPMIFSDTKHS